MAVVASAELADIIRRAQGCFLGQLAGDSLGSLVEFESPQRIRERYPQGVRDLADGGTWGTLAGQPTDDSEMALALARVLAQSGRYDPHEARQAYLEWFHSRPFDVGGTVRAALMGHPRADSQANGAMMRASPLGIFGAFHPLERVAEWARQDAAITHIHPICQQANALYVTAIAQAVRSGPSPGELYREIVNRAEEMAVAPELLEVVRRAATAPPADYLALAGWVLVAFHNALWQLLHAPSLEEGVVDTVMRGGDTDTNAAICGALLGAVYGREAVPERWVNTLLNCRPEQGRPGVRRPRPERYWPVDALELAERLVLAGLASALGGVSQGDA